MFLNTGNLGNPTKELERWLNPKKLTHEELHRRQLLDLAQYVQQLLNPLP